MNTTEPAGVKPATDEEIAARLKFERDRVSNITSAKEISTHTWISAHTGELTWGVSSANAHGFGPTIEEAMFKHARSYAGAQRRAAIEARVRAEMEAGV